MKASVMTPETAGQIHMVVGITQETPENQARTIIQECAVSIGGRGGEFKTLIIRAQCLWMFGNHQLEP